MIFGKRKSKSAPAIGGNQQGLGQMPFLTACRTADGGMSVHIDPSGVESPAIAGIMLADFYRHFARMLAQTGKAQHEEGARAEMLALFMSELRQATDEGNGSLQDSKE